MKYNLMPLNLKQRKERQDGPLPQDGQGLAVVFGEGQGICGQGVKQVGTSG